MDLKWLVFCIFLGFDGLVMAAAFTKWREVKAASRWLPATAKITASRSQARKVDVSSGTGKDRIAETQLRNFAAVTYAFDVDGKRHEGNRISIAHDVGNYQVAEKLARYPVGATTTIFYDPANPNSSVIERDMSARSFEIAFLVGALVAVIAVLFMLLSEDVASRFSQYLPADGRQSGAMVLFLMGIAALFLAMGVYKRGAATASWPQTQGVIISSAVDSVKYQISYQRYGRLLRERTIYSYRVAGVTYRSDRTSLGAQVYSSLRFLARRNAERFTAGKPVDVFYDPKAPAQAVLIHGAPGQFLIWLAAMALFAGAAWLSGAF